MKREKQNENNRRYYWRNREWVCVKNNIHYHKNRVRILQKQKEKDDTRRPALRKQAQKYYEKNKEIIKKQHRTRYNERKMCLLAVPQSKK